MNPISWEPLSPIQASACAARPQVEREKADDARARARARCTSTSSGLVLQRRHAGEERRRDHREAARQAVHVVEQVEGVRHPDQPEEAEGHREPGAVDDLRPRVPVDEDDRGARRPARASFDDRRKRPEVVDRGRRGRAGVAPAKMPTSCVVAVSGPSRTASQMPDGERRRRCRCRRRAVWRARLPARLRRESASSLREYRERSRTQTTSAATGKRDEGRERCSRDARVVEWCKGCVCPHKPSLD